MKNPMNSERTRKVSRARRSSRRDLLRNPWLLGAGAATLTARVASARSVPTNPKLLVVFLRGGCDMLAPVMPYLNAEYPNRRDFTRGLAPTPQQAPNEVVPLTTKTGMPYIFGGDVWGVPKTCVRTSGGAAGASGGIKRMWDDCKLAVIEAAGSSLDSLSHFSKMAEMETAGVLTTGWIARYLAETDAAPGQPTVRGIATSPLRPRSLAGSEDVVASSNLRAYDVDGPGLPPNSTTYKPVLRSLYSSDPTNPLYAAGIGGFDAVNWAQTTYAQPHQNLGSESYGTSHFGKSLENIAQAFVQSNVEIGHVDLGGFDTHGNEDLFTTDDDSLGKILQDLFLNLEAFYLDMLGHNQSFVALVMSEFGRRAEENDSQGTDHGKGGVMFALGDAIKGGRFYGTWSGLEDADLDANLDFPVQVDYRQVVTEVLEEHMGLTDPTKLSNVLAGGPFPHLGIL